MALAPLAPRRGEDYFRKKGWEAVAGTGWPGANASEKPLEPGAHGEIKNTLRWGSPVSETLAAVASFEFEERELAAVQSTIARGGSKM